MDEKGKALLAALGKLQEIDLRGRVDDGPPIAVALTPGHIRAIRSALIGRARAPSPQPGAEP